MTGIVPKWSEDAAVDPAPCAAPAAIQGTKLKNAELRMVYVVMLIAYGSACVLLAVELGLSWLVGRCRRARSLTSRLTEHVGTISAVQRVMLRARSGTGVKGVLLDPGGGSKSSG